MNINWFQKQPNGNDEVITYLVGKITSQFRARNTPFPPKKKEREKKYKLVKPGICVIELMKIIARFTGAECEAQNIMGVT